MKVLISQMLSACSKVRATEVKKITNPDRDGRAWLLEQETGQRETSASPMYLP